jgi:hypothetical protein
MEHPPPLLQETAIGHFVGEGMFESILPLGEQARFVQELRRLEMGQAALHSVFRQLGNSLQQREGHFHADGGSGLEQVLRLRRQPVNTRRQHRLHGGWHLHRRQDLP